MKNTRDLFKTWANHPQEEAMDGDSVEQNVSILSALFCSMRYITDERHNRRGDTWELECMRNERKNNVELFQMPPAGEPTAFQSHGVLAI